jgi:hypothetical protein
MVFINPDFAVTVPCSLFSGKFLYDDSIAIIARRHAV